MTTKAKTPCALLNATQIREMLGVSKATFYGCPSRGEIGLLARLRAKGLRIVSMPSVSGHRPLVRYTAASFDKLITSAALKENQLC